MDFIDIGWPDDYIVVVYKTPVCSKTGVALKGHVTVDIRIREEDTEFRLSKLVKLKG